MNKSTLYTKGIILLSILMASAFTLANDNSALQKASNAACDKIKMCIKKQVVQEQDISPEMVKMIERMAESSCKNLYKINELTAYDNLVEPITKCYQAMANSSCEALEDGKQPKACLDLEKAVENL